MWKHTFPLVLFITSTTVAWGCEPPPDPQYDPAGYADWCDCMGGWVDYSAGVGCSGATRPRQESIPSAIKHGSGGESAATDDSEACHECGQALINDIAAGLQSSSMIRSYVNQSRAKYANCTRNVDSSCNQTCGRRLFNDIPLSCDSFDDDASYADCVETLINGARFSCR